MERRQLGRTGFSLSPIGFGAFKIGRDRRVKYPVPYEIPDDAEAGKILNAVLDLGVNLMDTAPAYGLSEDRIGRHLSHRRQEFVLCSKVGETFQDGQSNYAFDGRSIRESVEGSLRRLKTECLDLLLLHSDGNDLEILHNGEAIPMLQQLKQSGDVRAIGLSGKTPEGAEAALDWADVLMVEYHLEDTTHVDVMQAALKQGVGVLVKKGLAAGRLPAEAAVRFVLESPAVASMVVGSLNLDHLRANLAVAQQVVRAAA